MHGTAGTFSSNPKSSWLIIRASLNRILSSKGPVGMCSGDWARRASVPLGKINPAGAHFVRAVGIQCLGNSNAALPFTPFPT